MGCALIGGSLVAAACKSESSEPGTEAGGKSGNAGAGGASAGKGGAGAGGSTAGTSNGGEAGAESSSTGGKGGTAGKGGNSSTGGSGAVGEAGQAGGEAGGAAGSDNGSGGSGPAAPKVISLPGPDDDQQPEIYSGALEGCLYAQVFTDADGNFAIPCGTDVIRFASDGTRTKFSSTYTAPYARSTVSSSGDALVAGRTSTGLGVTRYDGTGDVVWQQDWAAAGSPSPTAIVAAEDGNVYVSGTVTGQVPNNPPTGANGAWLASYDLETGDLNWLKQYPTADDNMLGQSFMFPAERASETSLYFFFGYWRAAAPPAPSGGILPGVFAARDTDGELLWGGNMQNGLNTCWGSTSNTNVSFSGVLGIGGVDGSQFSAYGASCVGEATLDAANRPSWSWLGQLEPARTVVIDEVEGTEWTGKVTDVAGTILLEDELYVSGTYQNSYRLGATPPPTTVAAFVARYTRKGERLWFKEYTLGTGPRTSGQDGGPMALTSKEVIVNGTGQGGGVFKVSRATGEIVDWE